MHGMNNIKDFDRGHPVAYVLTILYIKNRQTQLSLYIHIKFYLWATSFGLITTIIQAHYAQNISYL